jgi:hypothetical protein
LDNYSSFDVMCLACHHGLCDAETKYVLCV